MVFKFFRVYIFRSLGVLILSVRDFLRRVRKVVVDLVGGRIDMYIFVWVVGCVLGVCDFMISVYLVFINKT